MNVTFFYFGALFFGSVALYNLYSARKYGESYLPVVVGMMMFISLIMLIVLPWQYGYVAFIFTAIFSVVKYRSVRNISKKKMERYIGDSKNTEPLKPVDYFTGWKLLHYLSAKYGPNKAALINSVVMWFFGIFLAVFFSYLWPKFFSNIWYIVLVMTIIMSGFHWQNKKLLESLESGDQAGE